MRDDVTYSSLFVFSCVRAVQGLSFQIKCIISFLLYIDSTSSLTENSAICAVVALPVEYKKTDYALNFVHSDRRSELIKAYKNEFNCQASGLVISVCSFFFFNVCSATASRKC